jgi:hypothetical protein
MRRTLLKSLLVLVTVAWVTPAEAQLGGMIRRAKEAAEKKAAPEPATTTANPFADPAVVFISQDQLARFEKALQYEIDQRNALRASLASATRSKAEYQACAQSAAMSPEMMQKMQDWADEAAKLPPEKAMEAVTKMTSGQAAVVEKQCGPDPSKSEGSRFERLRQIEAEASDVAMPAGFKPASGARGRMEEHANPYGNVAFSYRAPRPYFPSFEARAQAANAHPFARHYGMLKERIPVFCAKDKKMSAPTTITVGNEKMTIVKVRAAQGGLEYVFRQDEVDALNAGCASVMTKMNALFDLANQ